MCGENATRQVTATDQLLGIPPRVWGKLPIGTIAEVAFRNTPTCVGKTIFSFALLADNQEYPHVCGENYSLSPTMISQSGIPPRVWGKP